MTSIILLLVGLLLIFLEFYTPGGILAVFGTIFIIAANLTFFSTSTSLIGWIGFFVATVLLLIFVIWFALKCIRKSAPQNTFYLSDDQEGYLGAHFDSTLINKTGIALTDFGPSGFALIDGKRIQATCRSTYLDKGTEIVVIGGEGAHLIIKPVNKETL